MQSFTKTVLYTDTDGRARFREENIPLPEGTPQAQLSPCLLYTSPSPRDRTRSRMPSSA